MDPVSEYIESIDQDWQRDIVKRLRTSIHELDKDIEESIRWGSAAFERAGPLLWIFSADNWVHISFAHGSLLDHSHGLFEPTKDLAQRTIKIRQQDKFPYKTISQLIDQHISNNLAGKRASFVTAKPDAKVFKIPQEYQKLLQKNGLLDECQKRPYYQQSGWIRWIEAAKQPATKERRIQQMFEELKAGNVYMKSSW